VTPLVFLLGGARSGKSSLAVRLAAESGLPVVFVATAGVRDDGEMRARIEAHRAERPAGWTTVEEPADPAQALAAAPADACVVLDCLTLWVANALESGLGDEEVEGRAVELARVAAARGRLTIVVSNEVGLGVVPGTPLGRRFRDVLGRVNAIVAAAADRASLVVAGRELELR
jgi:adenosyl cobinamide kinase/adenosyl cobinamide phosphate guanylyltransferase